MRLGIAMKEHRAIESEGRRVGREKRERKIERESKKERERETGVGRKGVQRRGNFHDVAARILWSP